MPTLTNLLENNRNWAKESTDADPHYFQRLSNAQRPEYLWIGCADSRVPANQILNLQPGQVFVHRNIANLVKEEDANCMSVLQYAVDVLKVKHVIVTGHYGCGGVTEAVNNTPLTGCLCQWIESIREVYRNNLHELPLNDPQATLDRMCELNVLDQTRRLSQTRIMKDAWARGHAIEIHSWIYSLKDGILRQLSNAISKPVED